MKAEAGFPQQVVSPALHDKSKKESSDMKRAMFLLLAVVVLAGLTGCATQRGKCCTACSGSTYAQGTANEPGDNCPDPGQAHCCRACGGHGCPLCSGRGEAEGYAPGPDTGAITYPYYTNRGPRDFLAKSPTSIGP